jgi:hypothetical protein
MDAWAQLPEIVLAGVTGGCTQPRLLRRLRWWCAICCQHASNAVFLQLAGELSWPGNERLRFKQELVGVGPIDRDSPDHQVVAPREAEELSWLPSVACSLAAG